MIISSYIVPFTLFYDLYIWVLTVCLRSYFLLSQETDAVGCSAAALQHFFLYVPERVSVVESETSQDHDTRTIVAIRRVKAFQADNRSRGLKLGQLDSKI